MCPGLARRMGLKPGRKSELGAERGTGPESPTDVAPERSSDSGMETEPEPVPARVPRPGARTKGGESQPGAAMGPGAERESGQDAEPAPELERLLETRPESWGRRSDGTGDWGVLLVPRGPEPISATCREPGLELELSPV